MRSSSSGPLSTRSSRGGMRDGRSSRRTPPGRGGPSPPRHSSRATAGPGDGRDRHGRDVLGCARREHRRPRTRAGSPPSRGSGAREGARPSARASVGIPLLVPDLPVFLWWTGTPPSDGRHVDDLVTLADRLIVDSADFARADLTLPEVARLARFRVGITDLNWARLTDWRELIAQFFDVPAWRPFLNGITGIRAGFAVDMDGRDIHPSQALLLLGWLASRLAWRPVERLAPSEAGGVLFKMARSDDAAVMVRLRPRFERGLDAGDVSGVRIQAALGGESAEFVIKRAPDQRHATATAIVGGTVRAERVVPLPALGIRERFAEEARRAASVIHPNVVTVFDEGRDGADAFMVMELVRGRTLRDVVADRGPLRPHEAARLVAQIAAALDAAHEAGVIHCDVKPANVIVDQQGTAKLTDFGIARAARGPREHELIGTARYIAPERIEGRAPTERSDVYSLGLVAYELIAGRPPNAEMETEDLLRVRLDGRAPSLRLARVGISEESDRVVAKALARDPQGRYASAGAFARELLAASQRDDDTC